MAFFIFRAHGDGGGGLVTKSCLTLATPCTVPARPLCSWDFLGKNSGVGCHFLGINEISVTCLHSSWKIT